VIGPVVLSEIHYHPELGYDEFVELRNVTGNSVLLFNPAHPSAAWRLSGLDFTFPTNTALPPNGLVLVVATDAASFRSRYALPSEVIVVGPFAGNLQDSGERLELQRPEVLGTNGVAYVTVDEVRYNDKAPWPPGADGSGASLQRTTIVAYGNDPANWTAALPTPGTDFISGDPPSITSQPQSQTIVARGDTTFQVIASGESPLNYQWLFNGGPIGGATNPVLLLRDVQVSQGGDYSVVVFNQRGSAVSAIARLTVHRPPTILVQPTNQFVRPGSNAVFTVSATGNGPLRYQWRFNDASVLNATNAVFTVLNAQAENAGAYSVIVTDNTGPATSESATLLLLVDPIIIQQPLSQTVTPGGTVSLSVTVTNTANLPIGYRWRRNGQNIPGGSSAFAQHTAFFTVTNLQSPFTNYTVVITNLAKPTGLLSATAVLTIVADADGDGLPDAWENAHGLISTNALDRASDSDSDGMTNWEEYLAGTDPTNALSYLKVESIDASSRAVLTFGAISNRTYTAQYSEALAIGSWLKLTDIVAHPTNRAVIILDAPAGTNRFYRITTPQQP
jgi:hypothetical protein